jgi:hypothetical protein
MHAPMNATAFPLIRKGCFIFNARQPSLTHDTPSFCLSESVGQMINDFDRSEITAMLQSQLL